MIPSGEVWRDVPGYEGLYRASTLGRFWVLKRQRTNGGKPQEPGIWQGDHKCTLIGDGRREHIHLSKVILRTFVGPCPPGMECCHANDDRSDNRLVNLRWDTHRANKMDAFRNGATKTQGERHADAKLTDEKVLEARRQYAADPTPETYKRLARENGVTDSAMYLAATGKTWRHLP